MTTYYLLVVLYDGVYWRDCGTRFPTLEAASKFRDEAIADSSHWSHYPIVKQGLPTRIVEVQFVEQVVRKFPGLPVEGET